MPRPTEPAAGLAEGDRILLRDIRRDVDVLADAPDAQVRRVRLDQRAACGARDRQYRVLENVIGHRATPRDS
jgi:hypothetical protein